MKNAGPPGAAVHSAGRIGQCDVFLGGTSLAALTAASVQCVEILAHRAGLIAGSFQSQSRLLRTPTLPVGISFHETGIDRACLHRLTRPSLMHGARPLEQAAESSLSRKRPCLFLENVE